MDEQIVRRAVFESKGFAAAARGDSPDSHGLHWRAAALPDWERGYQDGLAASPELHSRPASAQRIDARQGGAHL